MSDLVLRNQLSYKVLQLDVFMLVILDKGYSIENEYKSY